MLRLPLLCVLAKILLICENVEAQGQVEMIFDSNTGLDENTKICEQEIEGSGNGCYECYSCDNSKVKSQRYARKTDYTFKLANKDCSFTPLCCFSQKESRARTNTRCGTSHPDGNPRRVRNSLREVLPGQFPWRTWIYTRANPVKPECAGVYMDSSSGSVVTSASCLKKYENNDLSVKFLKKGPAIPVQSVYRHSDFNEVTQDNDIAILKLGDGIPSWAEAACLDESKVQLSSACITVSADDKYINSIVPRQSRCEKQNLTASQLCAITPWNDYEPEMGGGLVCENEDVGNKIRYTVYGIKVKSKDNISIYTNITAFNTWLDENFME